MQLVAMSYLLIYDVASSIVWMVGIIQAVKDIFLGVISNLDYRNKWIIVVVLYLAEEFTLDLFAEIERTNLDREKLKIIEDLGIILFQIPKIIVYMFVIMPARVCGTITYTWRKNVW